MTAIRCANPKCEVTFEQTKPTRLYCSKPCRMRDKQRQWRERNPESAKFQSRQNQERHREARNARTKTWREANKEYVLANDRRRFAEKREEANAERKARYRKFVTENPEVQKQMSRELHAIARQTYPWTASIGRARGRAKKKGVPFELTIEWGEANWTGKCAMTGLPFNMDMPGTCGPKIMSPSIDRIVPSKGYTPDNCRFVLWAINAFKGEGTDEAMLFLASELLKSQVKSIT